MYSNFIFIYIKNRDIHGRMEEQRKKTVCLNTDHSSRIFWWLVFTEWHGTWNCLSYLFILFICERIWLNSCKLNVRIMRLHCTQFLSQQVQVPVLQSASTQPFPSIDHFLLWDKNTEIRNHRIFSSMDLAALSRTDCFTVSPHNNKTWQSIISNAYSH
jgi:hypothetical protein